MVNNSKKHASLILVLLKLAAMSLIGGSLIVAASLYIQMFYPDCASIISMIIGVFIGSSITGYLVYKHVTLEHNNQLFIGDKE